MSSKERGQSPLATVLIPAYNPGSQLLEASVCSALLQDYAALEVLIVDDGSTDGSPSAVVARVADDRVRLVRQQNAGLAAALNFGLSEARGEVVVRLDADDLASPARVSKQVNALNNPDIGIVGGQIRRTVAGEALSVSRFPLGHAEIMQGLRQRSHVLSHPAVAFRRADAIALGGYWDYGVSEDWDFFLRMGESKQLCNLNEVVLDYRFHAESINGRQLATVRRNMRLAVENHHRRIGGLSSLTPDEFRVEMSAWDRLTCSREVFSLSHYRKHLQARASERRATALVHLGLSASAWPEQTLRRLSAHWMRDAP